MNQEGTRNTTAGRSDRVCCCALAPSKTEDGEARPFSLPVLGSPGKAGNLQPEKAPDKWVKPFSELLTTWSEALESNIRFIKLCPKWGKRFKEAEHPVAYLRKTLDHIEGDRIRYEAKRDTTRSHPPASAPPPQLEGRPKLSPDRRWR